MLAAGDGIEVVGCGQLPGVLDGIEQSRPDVLMTDVWMPPRLEDEGVQLAADHLHKEHTWEPASMPARLSSMKVASVICVLLVVTVGCGSSQTSKRTGSLLVKVTAGPTCPVARVDDPACAPRPVNGAHLRLEGPTDLTLVTDNAGVARGEGIIVGNYRLVPEPLDGLMGTPSPLQIVIHQRKTTHVTVGYDTGIR